jgi:RNA polymerase sigma-70 factor (ECF subfamily)
MSRSETPAILRDIHTLLHLGTSHGLTDVQLLDRFRDRSDLASSEAAFAALIARHGPMVLGVCRRALSNPDDVADAFQATFLILVRKAEAVRVEDSLGRWLYGVSRRVSVRARVAAARRRAREVREVEIAASPAAGVEQDELRDAIDEEIGRLPERLRSAVVLCALEGLGHGEAARRLGCAEGTVKSRLSRARERLRARLARRGLAPTAGTLPIGLTTDAVPADLVETTIKAAGGYLDGVVGPAITLLIRGVLRAMLLRKISTIAITVAASLTLVTGAGVLARQAGRQHAEKQAGVESEPEDDSARDTAAQPGGSEEQEDELDDRIETLSLDLEALMSEVRARGADITVLNDNMAQMKLRGLDGEQSSLAALQKKLSERRKEYVSSKKEMLRKQEELSVLRQTRHKQKKAQEKRTSQPEATQTAESENGGATRKSDPHPPAAPDSSGISPLLEKRLSQIEGKLEDVLKAIEDLRRKIRR